MSNVVRAPFGAAAVLAGALGLSGCTDSPYEPPQVPVSKSPTGFSATLIQEGDFFSVLKDGAHRLEAPAEPFGGKLGTKVPCLLIRDSYDRGGFSGLSCDWSKLQPASP